MGRNSDQATSGANQANAISGQSASNANALYGSLAPTLQAQAANPQGFTPATLAKIKTSNEQGAGGGMAGAVGQGSLLASRTRNAGTADAAIGEAARASAQQLGGDNLKADLANENLKQDQRSQALAGLGNLYSTNTGNSVNALGQTAANVNANTNQENSSWNWSRNLLQPILGAASGSKYF